MRLFRVGVGLAVAVLLGGLVSLSGAVVPQLSHRPGGSGSGQHFTDELGRTRALHVDVDGTFVNESWLPVTLTGVNVRARGFRVVSVPDERSLPRTIGRGEEFALRLGPRDH